MLLKFQPHRIVLKIMFNLLNEIWVVSKNMMEPITRTYRNIGGSFM